jgi:hypothetical protein
MSNTIGATGSGVVLSIGNAASPPTYTSILQLKSISWTQPTLGTEDATCLSSPTIGNATVKQYLPTVIEPGKLEATAIYLSTDTGLGALSTAFSTQTISEFKLQFPVITAFGQTTTGNLYSFSGYVLEQPLPDGIDPTKLLTYKVSIQITTAVTFTAGS